MIILLYATLIICHPYYMPCYYMLDQCQFCRDQLNSLLNSEQQTVFNFDVMTIKIIIFIFFYIAPQMRKVLAVTSVSSDHKELVLKELKNIFKKLKISLQVLLQDELAHQNLNESLNLATAFKSYPYITLCIPNYEAHREYLEKVYKSNVLFNKFILLISEGKNYEELIINRSEEILNQQCRNWDNTVDCDFSSQVSVSLEQQVIKIQNIFGQMDIRGKISKIDAEKKFHLIEDHNISDPDPMPDCCEEKNEKTEEETLKKLFFGLELARAGGASLKRGGSEGSSYYLEYQEETIQEEKVEENERRHVLEHDGNRGASWLRAKRMIQTLRNGKRKASNSNPVKQMAPNLIKKNPYLKKEYVEVVAASAL